MGDKNQIQTINKQNIGLENGQNNDLAGEIHKNVEYIKDDFEANILRKIHFGEYSIRAPQILDLFLGKYPFGKIKKGQNPYASMIETNEKIRIALNSTQQ